jgi:hypothetical protein
MSIRWGNSSAKRYISLFALYWIIALATHAEGLYQPMHNDLSVRLRVARDWRAGLKLYEETYENTQPTYFFFILLVDSSRPEVTHYLGETFLAAVAALALYGAMRWTVPRCAMVAPVLLIAWTGIGPTFYGGQITEGISIWFDVIAMCLFFEAVRRNSATLALLAGISFFLMVSIRIPCVLHGVAYIPLLWVLYREQGFPRALGMVLSFVGGFTLALAAMIFYAVNGSYFHAFVRMLARNFEYASASRTPFTESVSRSWATISAIIHANPAFLILMAISILVLLLKAKKSNESKVMSDEYPVTRRSSLLPPHYSSLITHHSSLMTYLWLWVGLMWLAAALASAFPGGRHFAHYYHVAWPPVCVLSVLWLSRSGLFARDPRFRRRVAWGMSIAFTVMAVVLNARGFVREVRRNDSPRVAIQQAVDYLNQVSTPDSIIAVPVWGQWAELWWRAPRPSVSRCFAPQCFYVINREMFEEWVQAMIDRPPGLIVADASLIGPLSRYSPYDNTEFRPPPGHPLYQLRNLVDENYVEIYRIDDLSFLARRNGPFDPHRK